MPLFLMLVGLPAAGKTTILKELEDIPKVILSTDDFIEQKAIELGKTYDEIFKETIREAEEDLWRNLHNAIFAFQNIVWDQTNLTVKTRQRKLSKIPDSYFKVACYIPKPDDEEWRRRLLSRPGKTIPDYILSNMNKTLVKPTVYEGFEMVIDDAVDLGYLLKNYKPHKDVE